MNAVTSLNMVSISCEPDQKVIAWALCSGIRADRYSVLRPHNDCNY